MSINLDIINKTCVFVAKRCSGKSEMIKYLVQHHKQSFDKIYVICPTEIINNFYSSIVPSNCVFDEYSEEWVDALIKKMTEINANKPTADRKNVLLILDDLVADVRFASSPTLKRIFTRGRHINISIIMTTQYLTTIPPICRNNCDWVLAGQLNRQSVQLLADEYLSGGIDKSEFLDLYNRSTKDYNFLVINNNSIKDSDNLNLIYGIIRKPS